ncbi:MAG TPA: PD-(D/E)XK nuclease family protein [Solirubrobacteraceae bacterium]|nr:PD-(D/E)XK nuclease family protein [Solirubrobacteraceae bacterium]
MGLTLVTGPANSAKAQLVLERYRSALARGPILVVPRSGDVEHYRRELAGEGAVLGVRVEPFGGLMREIARRAGVAEIAIGEPARERLLEAVLAAASLELLAPAAQSPGFVRALARFVAELEARRVPPPRLIAALRAWSPPGSRRSRYGEELAGVYRDYRRALERLGRLDGELLATRALDALRLEPHRWGRTPVFCYGFDDLEPLQLDAIETLAHRVGTPVTISLPGEPGRVALAGRAAILETLRPGAEEVITLPPVDTYYEDATLHHLERSLFEDTPAPRPPGSAVRLLEGGDERAEAELIAAEIAELVAAGCAPRDIAVVIRGAHSVGALLAGVLDARGVPHAAARRERFADSALGGGLLAMLRAGLLGGGASNLVRWLRTPGVVAQTAFVDRFEAALLKGGIGELAAARVLWEQEHWPLDALDRLGEAARRPGPALLDRVERELEGLFAAPWRREAALLDGWQAAVLAAGRRTLRELRALTRADPALAPGPAAIAAALEAVMVELAAGTEADAVLVCDALALRARRVRALFIAGVQEGAFPAPAREERFLAAAERAELAQASGLMLGGQDDSLAAERYLFYALCSRPTRWLRVSWHDATDDGDAALRSLFVDDLADCFDAALRTGRALRGAGAVAWGEGSARAPALASLERVLGGPRRRGPVIGALAAPERLVALRGHDPHSASALERWVACPVSWFVERGLRARPLAPDALPLVRGSAAHEALRAVFVALRERAGSARVNAASLPFALEQLDGVLAEPGRALSPNAALDRAERRRLRSDLGRYLEFLAAAPSHHEPREFELAFGLADDPLPAASLAGGALELCGRIDRIDVDPLASTALIYDYKAASAEPAARWGPRGCLQPALYMLAVEQLLGTEGVGGLYQPLRTAELRPRGAVRADVEPAAPLFDNDRLAPEELRELIAGQLAAAVIAAGELTHGALEPRPASCTPAGGCRFPAICRCEAR